MFLNPYKQFIAITTKITVEDKEINLEFPHILTLQRCHLADSNEIKQIADKVYLCGNGLSNGYLVDQHLSDDDIIEVSKHLKIPYIEDTLKMNRIDVEKEHYNLAAFSYSSNVINSDGVTHHKSISLQNRENLVAIGKIDDILKIRAISNYEDRYDYGYGFIHNNDTNDKEFIKKRNKVLELIIKDSEEYINC